MRVARVAAQAKVNLVLMVGRRDESGYHEIFTQFQRIDLADDVVVRVGGSSRAIDCAGPRLPTAGLGPVEQNLAYRAAMVYMERTGFAGGFTIEITKNIPVGGGLGGGSADAGAVLRALNALAPRPLSARGVQALARTLGADVPFLVGESPDGLAFGRGDEWGPLPPPTLPVRDVVLAVPDFGIATVDAYRWLDEAGSGTLPDMRHPPEGITYGLSGLHAWQDATEASGNDFEAALEPRYPKLRELRLALQRAGASVARLSGSGSAVFGIFEPAPPRDLPLDALVIRTRTSARVVQVEVLE